MSRLPVVWSVPDVPGKTHRYSREGQAVGGGAGTPPRDAGD